VEVGIRRPDISGSIDRERERYIETRLVAGGGRESSADGIELTDGTVRVGRGGGSAAAIDNPDVAGTVDRDAFGDIETAAGVAGGAGDGRAASAEEADSAFSRCAVSNP